MTKYRVFEVDSATGVATPVENPKINERDVVLVSSSVKNLGEQADPNPKQSSSNKQNQ
jgi:hypothetical protein